MTHIVTYLISRHCFAQIIQNRHRYYFTFKLTKFCHAPSTSTLRCHSNSNCVYVWLMYFFFAILFTYVFGERGCLVDRVSDSRARGRGSILTRVAVKVLVIPRKQWLRPDMTDKLFTGTLSKKRNGTKTYLLFYRNMYYMFLLK